MARKKKSEPTEVNPSEHWEGTLEDITPKEILSLEDMSAIVADVCNATKGTHSEFIRSNVPGVVTEEEVVAMLPKEIKSPQKEVKTSAEEDVLSLLMSSQTRFKELSDTLAQFLKLHEDVTARLDEAEKDVVNLRERVKILETDYYNRIETKDDENLPFDPEPGEELKIVDLPQPYEIRLSGVLKTTLDQAISKREDQPIPEEMMINWANLLFSKFGYKDGLAVLLKDVESYVKDKRRCH